MFVRLQREFIVMLRWRWRRYSSSIVSIHWLSSMAQICCSHFCTLQSHILILVRFHGLNMDLHILCRTWATSKCWRWTLVLTWQRAARARARARRWRRRRSKRRLQQGRRCRCCCSCRLESVVGVSRRRGC